MALIIRKEFDMGGKKKLSKIEKFLAREHETAVKSLEAVEIAP